jgi:type IV pilus assembly protein PilV
MQIKRKGASTFLQARGFTLLEVLVAISVFAMGLLAVATMQLTAIGGNRSGNRLTAATFLAEAQLETLKAEDLASASLAPGNYNDPNNPVDETGANGGFFNRSWVVANHSAFARDVTVTVIWNETGLNRSVSINTITRGGGS